MGDAIQVPVRGEYDEYVIASAARVRAFWPGVSVTIAERTVALASELYARDRLEWIWTCALLNERLVEKSAERRSRVMADLLA